MKRLSSFLVALFLATTALWAYDFKEENLCYNITGTNTVAVTYESDWWSYNYRYLDSVNIPTFITHQDVTYCVTSVESNAFRGSKIVSAIVGDSVTNIGSRAFECDSLVSITIGENVTSIVGSAFSKPRITSVVWNARNCGGTEVLYTLFGTNNSVTSFVFGDKVESIPSYLCYNMKKLTSITIPISVTNIEEGAFDHCTTITSITIPNSVSNIGKDAFLNVCNVMYHGNATGAPWGAKSINGYVDGAFVYEDAVKKTLLGCTATGHIKIPNSVTHIGSSIFTNYNGVNSVTIPKSVTYIGKYAFYGCSSITKVNYTGDVKGWLEIDMENNGTAKDYRNVTNPVVWSRNLYINDVPLTNLVIPDGVTHLSSNFAYDNSLIAVTIPNSVTEICSDAFYKCTNLIMVSISDSVRNIEEGAFSCCENLSFVKLPKNLHRIDKWAFSSCNLNIFDNTK